MIKASDVKDLREKTGAGMMDCKKALEAVDGDIEKAIDWLREKGIAKAEKKASRIAAEGLTEAVCDGNHAVLFEVNCETDFVAQNDDFKKLIKEIGDALIKTDVKSVEEASKVELKDGKTIEDRVIDFTAKIGEKISFRRFTSIDKDDNEVFGVYSHMGGKITAVVTLKVKDSKNAEEVAKDIAMQAAAMAPLGVKRSDIPQDKVDREVEVIKEQIKNDEKNKSKPEDIIEKMATGRLNKFYKEVCLEEQEFIKDSSYTVSKYVSENGCELDTATRYQVGEGIEKKQEDFAEEVMSQINNA